MNNYLVDVIMPAYNCHKTIVRTLSSIALQKTNFKFLVTIINYGSEKNYSNEIDLFKNLLDINVINLDKNVGVAKARQIALDNTSGNYIIFVDSDDVFYDCMSIQKLYNLVEDGNCDYAFGALMVHENDTIQIYNNHNEALHSKIIKRELIEKNKIRFNTTKTSEDNSFNHLCLYYAKNIKSTIEPCYIYLNNDGSSLTRNISDEKMISNLCDYLDNILYVIDNVDNKYDYNIVKHYFDGFIYVWNTYTLIVKNSGREYQKFIRKILDFIDETEYLDAESLKNILNDSLISVIKDDIKKKYVK